MVEGHVPFSTKWSACFVHTVYPRDLTLSLTVSYSAHYKALAFLFCVSVSKTFSMQYNKQ